MAKVVTHDGVFHADETTGMAILRLLAMLRGVVFSFVRTRDLKVVEPGDVVIDVGGKKGEEGGVDFLDHHQRGGAGERPDGVPYAACGLVWEKFGRELLRLMYPALDAAEVEKLHSLVDGDFIAPVDAADCGFKLATGCCYTSNVRSLSFSAVIASLNPAWHEEQDFNAAFAEAVQYAQVALKGAISRACGTLLAESHVKDALAVRTSPRILLLDKFCPWQEAVFVLPGGEELLYVVFRQGGEGKETWMCQAVPDAPGSFGKRKALPKTWGGQRDAALQELTGVEDAIFCHPGLFIAGAGSKEGALKLAVLALAAE